MPKTKRGAPIRGRGPLGKLRVAAGLSGLEAARRAKIHRSYLCALECGRYDLSVRVATDIARGWKVPVEAVIRAAMKARLSYQQEANRAA